VSGVKQHPLTLKEAGIALRPPGAWGRAAPAKPANGVTTDPMPPEQAQEVGSDAESSKPANEVTTDFGAELGAQAGAQAEPQPDLSPSASACEIHRETIETGLSRGRNCRSRKLDLRLLGPQDGLPIQHTD
jgi:hypothetical protein